MELVDLSGNNPTIKLLSSPNRFNAGSPITNLIPEFPGELIADTTNQLLWRACGTTNTDWMPVGAYETVGSGGGGGGGSTDSAERWVRATQGLNDTITLPPTDNKFMRNGKMGVYRPDQVT